MLASAPAMDEYASRFISRIPWSTASIPWVMTLKKTATESMRNPQAWELSPKAHSLNTGASTSVAQSPMTASILSHDDTVFRVSAALSLSPAISRTALNPRPNTQKSEIMLMAEL